MKIGLLTFKKGIDRRTSQELVPFLRALGWIYVQALTICHPETKFFVNCFAAVGNVYHRRGQILLARACYERAYEVACLEQDRIEMMLTKDVLDRILV